MVNKQIFLDLFNKNISQLQQKATVLLIALQQGRKTDDVPSKREYDLAKNNCLIQLDYFLKESSNLELVVSVKSLKTSLLGFESSLKQRQRKEAEKWGDKIIWNTLSLLELLKRIFGLGVTSRNSTVAGIRESRDRLAG